jgi:hypothetical protein
MNLKEQQHRTKMIQARPFLVANYHVADSVVAIRYIRGMFDIQRPSTPQPGYLISSIRSKRIYLYEKVEERPYPYSQIELVLYEGQGL